MNIFINSIPFPSAVPLRHNHYVDFSIAQFLPVLELPEMGLQVCTPSCLTFVCEVRSEIQTCMMSVLIFEIHSVLLCVCQWSFLFLLESLSVYSGSNFSLSFWNSNHSYNEVLFVPQAAPCPLLISLSPSLSTSIQIPSINLSSSSLNLSSVSRSVTLSFIFYETHPMSL